MTTPQKKHPIVYWRTGCFVLGVFILIAVGGYIYDRGQQQKESIYKSCVILGNIIVEQQTGRPVYQTLTAEVLRNADATGHPEVRVKVREQTKKISDINLPSCKRLSENTDSITPQKLKPTGRTKTGS